MKIRLHYWDCRGRAQSLRYILADLAYQNDQIDYQETFESVVTMMTTWHEHKSDPQIAGPFGTLPVLHWNDRDIFGQTLNIAHFLGRKFHLYGQPTSKITDADVLEGYIFGVVSCAYSDVIETAFLCIWQKAKIDDPNSPDAYSIQRIQQSLQRLNNLLKQSSTSFFYDQRQPTIADYFAFEAFTAVRAIHRRYLPEDCQALIQLEKVMKDRAGLKNYFEKNLLLKRFTAASDEQDYLNSIAQIK